MISVRDNFLSKCRRDQVNVTVFVTNGFQIKGTISAFDGEVVTLLREDGRQLLVFQSAISTILPDAEKERNGTR